VWAVPSDMCVCVVCCSYESMKGLCDRYNRAIDSIVQLVSASDTGWGKLRSEELCGCTLRMSLGPSSREGRRYVWGGGGVRRCRRNVRSKCRTTQHRETKDDSRHFTETAASCVRQIEGRPQASVFACDCSAVWPVS
jgi:hypothetical protein